MSVARILKVASPFNSSELAEVDYAQSFDVLYLAHLNHDPQKLVRTGHTSWAFSTVTFGPTIAAPTGVGVTVTNPNQDTANSGNAYFPQPASYVVTAINDDNGQESRASSAASGTNDLTLKRNKNTVAWSTVTGADRYRVYKSENQQDYGFIGTTTQLSFTDDNIAPDLTDGPPEARNPFTAAGDKPSTVAFFEQRLKWARSTNVPNGMWSSRTADFENMDVARPTREDDAITISIAAQKVNSVNSLVPIGNLMAMTSDGIFAIKGSNSDYLAASPPPRALRQSGRGVSRLKPLVIDEVVFYRPQIGTEVRSLGFTFEIDGYRSSDVSIFSPSLFRGYTIRGWAYVEEPLSVAYAARSDGKLPAFTWQQEQQVWGWTLCETDGEVEDICSIQEGGESRAYLITARTIGGVERRFLERMASAKWSDVEDACYLDCALTRELDDEQVVTGLDHLEGATVDALVAGQVIKGMTVEDGAVDLGDTFTGTATIGLPYESVVETLPLVPQTNQGYSRDKRQMFGEVVIQVSDTRLGSIETGRRLEKMYRIRARGSEALGSATELFTGAVTVSTEPVTSGEATLFIRHSDPTPFTLTAAYLDKIVTER